MPSDRDRTRDDLDRIRQEMHFCIAMEEAAISAISDELERPGDTMPKGEAQTFWSVVLSHRVSVIRQRALIGALGIHG